MYCMAVDPYGSAWPHGTLGLFTFVSHQAPLPLDGPETAHYEAKSTLLVAKEANQTELAFLRMQFLT